MPQLLRDFIQNTESLRKDVARVKTTQVNSHSVLTEIQALVEDYFRNVRSSVTTINTVEELVRIVDSLAQELLTISHSRPLTSKLKHTLSVFKKKLVELETKATCKAPESARGSSLLPVDAHIIETLNELKPSAALAYEQALIDLSDEGRKSYRGPATDLREALREILDYLAPDSAVTSQQGYRPEAGTSGPTMKQKVRYVLSHRGPAGAFSETAENAAEAVDLAIGAFVRSVYRRSSISTHTSTDRSEVLRVREWVRIVLCELLSIPAS
jgi:hypothetical protein